MIYIFLDPNYQRNHLHQNLQTNRINTSIHYYTIVINDSIDLDFRCSSMQNLDYWLHYKYYIKYIINKLLIYHMITQK